MTMSTTDHTLLVILVVLMSVFFLLITIAAFGLVQAVLAVKRVLRRAEEIMETVEDAAEDAAEMIRDSRGKMTLFKTVKNIIKFAEKRRK